MRYRRADVKGGTYFFTVNLAERHCRLLVEKVDALRNAIRVVKQRHPFYIDAFVVLPDHLHAIWTLPEGDSDFAMRWLLTKAGFSRQMPMVERRSASRKGKGERGIWQRRYWEHLIRDMGDYQRHVDYIHYNPVKHGYVEHAVKWPYSSLHRYISFGLLGSDWGVGMASDIEGGYGE
ncbi:REP-associated tyrosine transposase [Sedimenticola selenatireducens]|uniref:REP-associated tyrosine transposase n=1 Tax=Sedimenticola selenatireducens TaxID=191960 RepID=UPI003F4AEBA1